MFSIFWPFQLLTGSLRLLLNLLVLASCILTVMAFMGERGWAWTLATHFHAQYLAIQLLALGLLTLSWLFSKREGRPAHAEKWLSLVVLMFFAGLNLVPILPYYMAAPDDEKTGGASVKLMHMNVFGSYNPNKQLVTRLIQEEKPDVIDLVEYTEDWQQTLERQGAFRRYPYRKVGAHIGLYSKIPMQNARITFADPTQKIATYASIVSRITIGHRPLTLMVAHPASPYLPQRLDWQRISFDAWRKDQKELGKHLILVGDLNTAPWSPEFKELVDSLHLRDSQLGRGLQPSWPTFLPFMHMAHHPTPWLAPLRIPIDHVLVSKSLVVLSRRTGPYIGSDHLPVITELSLRQE